MKDEDSILDHVGTGHGVETYGDVRRAKQRTEQATQHEIVMIWLTVAILIITAITLIVVIIK